ncbi:MAG TPA: hypothetical protein VFI49_04790 [Rudaea sp.]|nr:hypothetical protein [Rudaea sp.]
MFKATVDKDARGRVATLLFGLAATSALLVGAQVAQAQDTTEAATPDHACAEDQYKALGGSSTLNCVANDLVVSASAVINNNTVGACPNDGLVHLVDILVGIDSGSPERYDVGYFVGQTGNDPTAAGGQCSVAIFPTTGANSTATTGWFNGDANVCGDYHGNSSTTNLVTGAKVTCIQVSPTDPHLVVPYAIVYANNTNGACTSVNDVTAGTSSKCQAATVPVGNVFVTNDADPTCTPGSLTYDGTTITATVTISNNDPLHNQSADGTMFSDDFTLQSPSVTVQTVSCVGSGGAVCTIANNANVVTGTITSFPFGSSVQITITATPPPNPAPGSYSTGLVLTTPASVLPPAPPWVINTDSTSPQYGFSTLTDACVQAVQLPVKLQSFDVR